MLHVTCYKCNGTPANAGTKIQVFVQTKIKKRQKNVKWGVFQCFSPSARVREEGSGLFFVHLRRSATPTHGCVAHDAAQPVAYHHSEQKKQHALGHVYHDNRCHTAAKVAFFCYMCKWYARARANGASVAPERRARRRPTERPSATNGASVEKECVLKVFP